MKKSRKEFIIEAHKAACSEWKTKIEKEFPKLFKKEGLQIGKWYKSKRTSCIAFVQEVYSKDFKAYGFDDEMRWTDSCKMWTNDFSSWELATEEEVFDALKKESIKRGIWNVPIIYPDGRTTYLDDLTIYFDLENNWLRSKYGIVFENGVFATSIKSITKEEAEKQLGVKII